MLIITCWFCSPHIRHVVFVAVIQFFQFGIPDLNVKQYTITFPSCNSLTSEGYRGTLTIQHSLDSESYRELSAYVISTETELFCAVELNNGKLHV